MVVFTVQPLQCPLYSLVQHLQTWLGFVEARIRKLVDRFDLDRLPP